MGYDSSPKIEGKVEWPCLLRVERHGLAVQMRTAPEWSHLRAIRDS